MTHALDLSARTVRLWPWLALSLTLSAATFYRFAGQLPALRSGSVWPTIVTGSVAAALLTAVVYLALRLAGRRSLANLFLLAVLLRMAWAVFLFGWSHGVGWGGTIAADDVWYFELGSRMADEVRFGRWPDLPSFGGYYAYNALVNLLTNANQFAPVGLNCVVGALVVLHTYRIAGTLFDDRVAWCAAILLAVTPELCFWSAANLKDIHVIWGLVALTDWLVSFEQTGRTSLRWLGYVCFLLAYIASMRPIVAIFFVALIGVRVGRIWLRRRRRVVGLFGIAGVVVCLAAALYVAMDFFGSGAAATLAKYKPAGEEITASYGQGSLSAVASPVAIRQRPYLAILAYAYAMITPFPFFALHVLTSTAEFAAMFGGILFWYVVMLPFAVGFYYVARREPWKTLPVTWWVALLWTSIALETGGATFRYRASMLPFAAVLAAVAVQRVPQWYWLGIPYASGLVGLCAIYLLLK